MSNTNEKVSRTINDLERLQSLDTLAAKIKDDEPKETFESIPFENAYTKEGCDNRIQLLKKHGIDLPNVTGEKTFDNHQILEGNIENFIGMAQVPIGIAGPMRVRGTQETNEYIIPLATTEGALVASYSRGMKATRESGGITSICLTQGVQRSPFFKFESIVEAGQFVAWTLSQMDKFRAIVSKTSNHAQLDKIDTNVEGNTVILSFDYYTGDAAGQNMVTICTDRICDYINSECPIKPTHFYIESNFSGDKKATAKAFQGVRGKKVSAEVCIPKEVVEKVLKTKPEWMVTYWRHSTLAVVQSGSIGALGHVSNGLTALFMATGQDVACVSEASVGITRMEVNNNGDLYVAVTLPNLIVGTVGGGTSLPTQKECLEMMGCAGSGNAVKYAEICAALALCGEISIAAALSAGHFAKAHESLGRKS